MLVDGKPYRTIWRAADGRAVEIIDQTLLPHEFRIVRLETLDDAARAIRTMQVRGAPLIGVTAAYGLCLALQDEVSTATIDLFGWRVDTPARKYLFLLAVVTVFTLMAKNLVRGHLGRAWMAMRDMDVAAEVIGIRPVYAKLTAFAVSSFYVGVAGALWGFVHLGSWEPAAFGINRSFDLLFMVIIGGLGSISGAFFGAAFIVVLPLLLDKLPYWTGLPMDTATASHLALMIFGALIVFFLIKEPHGLARLWATAKEKLRLWPFPH